MDIKPPLTFHYPTIIAARNERDIVRDEHVDLSSVADFIQGYLDLKGPDDPYVHSAFVSRVFELTNFIHSQDMTQFEAQLGALIVFVMLETETFKVGDVNTPDEILQELFSPVLMAEFRQQLLFVPVIPSFDEEGQPIRVPDLFSCNFFARKLATIAETSKEIEARNERRLFSPNEERVHCELIDEEDIVGDEYIVSEFDTWAAEQNFPWDDENDTYDLGGLED